MSVRVFFFLLKLTLRFHSLPYDSFKQGLIALKDEIISVENMALSVTASRRYAPVTRYVTRSHTMFMT